MATSKYGTKLGRHFNLKDGDTPPIEAEEVEPVGETVDAATAEVSEAGAAVEAEDKAIEELTEAHENLEEVAAQLDAATTEGGGLTTESAKWARMTVNAIVGKYGLIDSEFMTMKSFGGDSTRTRATKLTFEAVGAMIKDFWATIWAKIKELWAKVKNWYLKVLDTAPKLKARAEKVRTAAEGKSGTAENKKIQLGELSKLCNGTGKVPSKSEFQTGLGATKVLAETVLTTTGEKISGNIEQLIATIEKPEDDAAAKTALTAIYDHYKSALKATSGVGKDREVQGADVKKSGFFLGNKAGIVYTATATGGTLKETVRYNKVELGEFSDKKLDIESSGDFETLLPNEVEKVCDSVIEICDVAIKYKGLWENRDRETAKMDAAAKKATAGLDKDKEAKDVSAKKTVITAAATGWRNVLTFETKVLNYALDTAKASLIYGERSLREYK